MGKAFWGIGIAAIAFLDYCCCRAASLAEKRLDDLSQGNRREEGAPHGSDD